MTFFKSFIQKPESISIPVQTLYFIPVFVAEYEQCILKRNNLVQILNDRCISINSFSKICNILYNINLWNIIKTNHNAKHIFMIRCISLSGADTLNSKRIPFNLNLMHPVFEDPISSFTSIATREGSSVALLYLLFAL